MAKLLWSRRGSRNRSIREEDGLATYQAGSVMVDTEEVIPIDKRGGYMWDQAMWIRNESNKLLFVNDKLKLFVATCLQYNLYPHIVK